MILFGSYLKNRTQLVKVQGQKSSTKPMVCGAPQGSVLGPLLFITYIKDLEEYLMDSRAGLYADDTALYYSSEDIAHVFLTLQDEMVTVSEWLRANKLSLNISTTKYMIFGSPYKTKNLPSTKLSVFGEEIELVTQFKYLGITLTQT